MFTSLYIPPFSSSISAPNLSAPQFTVDKVIPLILTGLIQRFTCDSKIAKCRQESVCKSDTIQLLAPELASLRYSESLEFRLSERLRVELTTQVTLSNVDDALTN